MIRWSTYVIPAELRSGSLVEDVQAVTGLMQPGVTVSDLNFQPLVLFCQVRNILLDLKVTENKEKHIKNISFSESLMVERKVELSPPTCCSSHVSVSLTLFSL